MKDLQTLITVFIQIVLLTFVSAQSIDKDISKLLEISGSSDANEEALSQMIDYFKISMPGNNAFFDEFKKEALSSGMETLDERLIPIYKEVYSHEEIKMLIKLYQSEGGEILISKQAELATKSMEVGRIWGEELSVKVIERMNNIESGEVVGNKEEIGNSVFGRIELLKNKHNKLIIDKEHNVGNLLLDFGDISDSKTSPLTLRIKNISSDTVVMQKTFSSIEELDIDFSNEVLFPGQEGKILFNWNTSCFEGSQYSNLLFSTDKGDSFSLGVKAQSENKDAEYVINKNEFIFQDFSGNYSEEYEFSIKNIGEIDLTINKVKANNSAVLISIEDTILPVAEEVKIIAIFSKELLERYENTGTEAQIEIEFGKCSSANWKKVEKLSIIE